MDHMSGYGFRPARGAQCARCANHDPESGASKSFTKDDRFVLGMDNWLVI